MREKEICKGCKWNHYPKCHGTILEDGSYPNIDNLRPGFDCGRKDGDTVKDWSIKKKTVLELRIEELENRIITLEEK